jgi:16S rRNA (guanine1516-N2)-methyltransferase
MPYDRHSMAVRSIESRCPDRLVEAAELAVSSGATHTSDPIGADEYRIILFEDREELWDVHSRRHGLPLSFRGLDRRIGGGNLSRRQPLGRAIGSKAVSVVDATAGLGHDASLLACMGWRVTAIERDPFLAVALDLSLRDADRCGDLHAMLEGRLDFRHGDAIEMLPSLEADVVYLDPMYTGRRMRSALPRKPAQVLQALAQVGDDAVLLAAARARADRVVVKRPMDGPSITEPDLVFKGRLVRYDVYLGSGQ